MHDLGSRYLDVLKKSLADALHVNTFTAELQRNGGVEIVATRREDLIKRIDGSDWPACAETMVGLKRLDNIQFCIDEIVARNVPGDLIETGVWRGGATIFMRGCLLAHGDAERCVWVADSFEGLPPPNPEQHPADAGDPHSSIGFLSASEQEVRENFWRYDLLDDQVKFLKGWFRDTLPTLRGRAWSLLRLDGDMYESTTDALRCLYPGLSPGGFVIIDDYGCVPSCRLAVDHYRAEHGVTDRIHKVDWTGVYWQKGAA